MFYAYVTVLCWSCASFSSSRIARILGAGRANRARLSLALIPLLAWYLWQMPALPLYVMMWFVVGGICHLGLGDLALYGNYRLVGPRLSLLLCLCLAAPLAIIIEWICFDEVLTGLQVVLCGAVLLSVAFALAPRERQRYPSGTIWRGCVLGLLSALGQCLGGVITRYAYSLMPEGMHIDGMSAAALRVGGGVIIVWLVFAWQQFRPLAEVPQHYSQAINGKKQHTQAWWPWLLSATIAGPIIGVSALQVAYAQIPSGIVLAILATLPLAVIPWAWVLDGDKPSIRSLVAGLVAVLALVALRLWS